MKAIKWLVLPLLLIGISLGFYIKNKNTSSMDYKTITAQQAKQMMDTNNTLTVLDVRTLEEYNSGHIKNALLLPYDEVPQNAKNLLPDPNATILVYCRSGRRSALAAQSLADQGYHNVYDFGGLSDWTYALE